MNNALTVAEIKRCCLAAIEEALQSGPVRIVKRHKAVAVVISEEEYQRLTHVKTTPLEGLTAVQWLLAQPAMDRHKKMDIDATLKAERDW